MSVQIAWFYGVAMAEAGSNIQLTVFRINAHSLIHHRKHTKSIDCVATSLQINLKGKVLIEADSSHAPPADPS